LAVVIKTARVICRIPLTPTRLITIIITPEAARIVIITTRADTVADMIPEEEPTAEAGTQAEVAIVEAAGVAETRNSTDRAGGV
jgi:hypothetical protein